MVAGVQSRFPALAADRASADADSLTSPLKTRVGVFRRRPSGRLSSRGRSRSIITPGSRACAYKTASGRGNWPNRDPQDELGFILLRDGKIKTISNRISPKSCLFCGKLHFENKNVLPKDINVYEFTINDPIAGVDFLGLHWWWPESKADKIADIAIEIANAAIDGKEGAEGVGDITALLPLCAPCVLLNSAAGILNGKWTKCVTDNPMPTGADPCKALGNALDIINGLQAKYECLSVK